MKPANCPNELDNNFVPLFLKLNGGHPESESLTKAKAEFNVLINKFSDILIAEERLKIKSLMLETARDYESLTVNNFLFDIFQKIGGERP